MEGEFVLPLPEGATVSGYALEVNDKLRDGVAVEKQRARDAYESVKRRMIDPGIVEREAGNTYRTRVFPVPAKGTKRLRISYLETLRPAAQELAYALPLDFPDSLGSFSCHLRGAAAGTIRVSAAAGLEFTAEAAGELKAEGRNIKPAGTLKLLVTPPDGPQMIVGNDSSPAFSLSDRIPEVVTRPRPVPAKVMLVWDASESGFKRDHTREFEVLDSWFAKLGTSAVSLRLLRERLDDGGEFEIRGGRWPKLRQALQQIDYDGATDLSRLQVAAGQADLVVLVSDGIATLGADPPAVAAPFVFIRSAPGAPARGLMRLARSTGGAGIDLTTDTPAEAVAKLTLQPLRLLALTGADLATFEWEQDLKSGQVLRVSGTLRERRAGKLELSYGFGNERTITREISYQPGGNGDGVVRRLHAQCVLARLEQQDPPDARKIIGHCKQYGLVSDYTSLIVLDRMEDYVAYQIPPPELELQAEFNKLVADRAQQTMSVRGKLVMAWEQRLHWYRQGFPGYEAVLLPRFRQVGIWKKAVESQFAPAQRDAEAFAAVAGWSEKAAALIAKRPALKTKGDYQTWLQAVNDMQAQGPKLAQTPTHLPPNGQPLTVSVRGFVAKPGLVTGEAGITLRQAVAKAGGPDPLGGLDNVALYRNAGKTVYNTLSNNYQDVPLFPGDMVVVGKEGPIDPIAPADPFAPADSHPRAPDDPGKQPPIREEGDLWLQPGTSRDTFEPSRSRNDNDFHGTRARPHKTSAGLDRFGGAGAATPATPSGTHRFSPPQLPQQNNNGTPQPDPVTSEASAPVRHPEPATQDKINVRAIVRNEFARPALAAFAKDITAGRDPAAAYRKLKGTQLYQSNFYLEAARVLFANRHPELGRRVLSNIVEARPGDTAALRAYAFWLAEFGQGVEAAEVLRAVSADDPSAWKLWRDRASIQAANGSVPAAVDSLMGVFDKLPEWGFCLHAAIALTELNALQATFKTPNLPHPLTGSNIDYRRNLAADIRIVATSTSDGNSLQLVVMEPGGFEASSSITPYGGTITDPDGISEYMIRQAVPGIYQISCSGEPAAVRVVIHRNWGRPDHTFKVVTLSLVAGKPQTIGEVDVEF